MFGYIFPDKPELKIREFSEYRAVYCSLCGALREFGFGAKALLNYDFVFAAMLMRSLRGGAPEPFEGRCNTNPLEKVALVPQSAELRFCAAALLVSGKYKLEDNAADENFPRRMAARLALLALRPAFRRAEQELPAFAQSVKTRMEAQRAFEASGWDSLDAACDQTAGGLADLFALMSDQPETVQILRHLGYLIGRYVYLADCGDDLRDDLKKGRYNPLIRRCSLTRSSSAEAVEGAVEELRAQLFATIAQIETSYRFLQPDAYREILDNIIYLGLYKTAREIGVKQKGKRKV